MLVKGFFSELFADKSVNKDIDVNMTNHVPVLSCDQRQRLEVPPTLEELSTALSSLEHGKTPGIDGLPVDFFTAFWDILGPEVLLVLQESVRSGILPLSCRKAVVSLLPKGGDLQRVENWRPISLLCSDYKILSKLLANRLKSVIGTVVHVDQSYCIPGRSISDNIFLIRDLIDCGLKEDGVGLLFLDIEKAFDSVDHTYMFHVLQKFGFGEKFILL